MGKKRNKKYTDWYEVKCNKAEQKMYDDLANQARQTKEQRREENRKNADPLGAALGYSINTLNHVIDGDFSFHADRFGKSITAIHYGLGQEAVYQQLYRCPITDERSVFRTISDTLQFEDDIRAEYNLKELRQQQINLNYDRGWWHHTSSIFSPQLCFRDGGAVTVGSDRLHDCVNARIGNQNAHITKHEHIVAEKDMQDEDDLYRSDLYRSLFDASSLAKLSSNKPKKKTPVNQKLLRAKEVVRKHDEKRAAAIRLENVKNAKARDIFREARELDKKIKDSDVPTYEDLKRFHNISKKIEEIS